MIRKRLERLLAVKLNADLYEVFKDCATLEEVTIFDLQRRLINEYVEKMGRSVQCPEKPSAIDPVTPHMIAFMRMQDGKEIRIADMLVYIGISKEKHTQRLKNLISRILKARGWRQKSTCRKDAGGIYRSVRVYVREEGVEVG